jgi:hypothetical protein
VPISVLHLQNFSKIKNWSTLPHTTQHVQWIDSKKVYENQTKSQKESVLAVLTSEGLIFLRDCLQKSSRRKRAQFTTPLKVSKNKKIPLITKKMK